MDIIVDGGFNKDLITLKKEGNLPISHVIAHVPGNPMGNSSIFLPKNLPSMGDFEDFITLLKENGIVPIAGLDSTCQGNLEAHAKQVDANLALLDKLKELEINEILVSSPNNVGFLRAKYPASKIYLSYSQFVTTLNRARIFFDIGVDVITVHPDILRDMKILENMLKLPSKMDKNREFDYILPLNIGCNWGCIQWYSHHNMQSHRTTFSPVLNDQESISGVKHEYDHPLLYCWRRRINEPGNLLRAGWISPDNLQKYQKLGYNKFLVCTNGMDQKQAKHTLQSYAMGVLEAPLNKLLNIPHPYGDYWQSSLANESLGQLEPSLVKEFNANHPSNTNHAKENEIEEYCAEYGKKLKPTKAEASTVVLEIINQNLKRIHKGAIAGD
ncbi:MAG: hypothetical protein ACFFCS_29465 [Candidatus Hodarchaeota archaeon]